LVCRPIVPAPDADDHDDDDDNNDDYDCGAVVECELSGETEAFGENMSRSHFAHYKSHMIL
jgi:hypothetical protein